jgi:hypothetical protein
MYAAAFIGNKIIDLAGWDQGSGAETSNLSISYDSQFQSVSYVGGTWGRQFWRPGTMATVSFDSRFSFPDPISNQYQRFVSYFLLVLPTYFSNQQGATLKLAQPYPTAMGTRQVETATGIGTITGSGNVRVTLTAAGIDINPLAIDVPVTLGQTASQWMQTVRNYFSAIPQVQMQFSVSGSGADMILTRRSPYAGNDSTLNIAIAQTTATGITAAPTSVNTTAGVAFSPMNEITFYDANISVAASQVGTSVLLNTSVTGRLVAP